MARRFQAQASTIHQELQVTLKKMRATGLRVSQNIREKG